MVFDEAFLFHLPLTIHPVPDIVRRNALCDHPSPAPPQDNVWIHPAGQDVEVGVKPDSVLWCGSSAVVDVTEAGDELIECGEEEIAVVGSAHWVSHALARLQFFSGVGGCVGECRGASRNDRPKQQDREDHLRNKLRTHVDEVLDEMLHKLSNEGEK